MRATRSLLLAALLAATPAWSEEPALRPIGGAPLGPRVPVVFVHGHGMDGIAAPLYATWAKFLQGRAADAGADWWAGHKPYLFTYDVAAPGADYADIGDALAAALAAEAELFEGDTYRPAAPLVGVTFSAGALVWHQAMRAFPREVAGTVYSVSAPTQGTVGATFLGPYALDRGGADATARFRAGYARRFQETFAADFVASFPEDVRARVRREFGAANDAAAGRALAARHWATLVEVYESMADHTAPSIYRSIAADNLGPGGGALIDPARLVALGAVDLEGKPFVNAWLRELHAAADYSKARVYMGRGNTDLRRGGLAGLLAGGGLGGASKAERQRRVTQDVTRSAALPAGLTDSDPTVPRALGAGEFLPEGNRPEVIYVERMSHHQGVFHPGVLLHILDSMMAELEGAAPELPAARDPPPASPTEDAPSGGPFGL